MSNFKKNNWLKFKTDFFASAAMKKMRKIAGGDTYVIIYQKLMLLTVNSEGHYKLEGIEATIEEEISLILDEEIDNVKIAINIFKSLNLIEHNNNVIFLPQVPLLIGKNDDSTLRVAAYRDRQKLKCNALQSLHVTESNALEKRREDTDQIRSDKDKIKNIDTNKEEAIAKIYEQWNLRTNNNLKGDKAVISNLEVILKTYTIEDIFKVIDFMILDKKTYFDQGYLTLSTLARTNLFSGKLERANNYKPQQSTKDILHNCNSQDYSGEF